MDDNDTELFEKTRAKLFELADMSDDAEKLNPILRELTAEEASMLFGAALVELRCMRRQLELTRRATIMLCAAADDNDDAVDRLLESTADAINEDEVLFDEELKS